MPFELLTGFAYNHRVRELETEAINACTRYCAVYGHPIRHSASPAMQNAGMQALGLNWRYLAFDVHPEHLAEAIRGALRMNFIGLNLTVPHKILAEPLMDVLDDSAREWGAVNTVRFEGRVAEGTWQPLDQIPEPPIETRSVGFNTDAEAITRVVREELELNLGGCSVLLLGAGGAGRTAALKFASEGVRELFVVNRTFSKAEEVHSEIKKRFPAVEVRLGYPQGPVDLMVNATSLGLKAGDPLPFETTRFEPGRAGAVFDMIYRPAKTALLKAAQKAGCRTANGLGMLLYQGARALEIWTGQTAPVAVMRRALEANVYG